MRRAASFLLIATLMLALAPARADVRSARDPRDTLGPQDIRRIEHAHGRRTEEGRPTVRFVVRSENEWSDRRLQCSTQSSKCRSIFDIFITTDERRDIERRIQVFRRGGRVQAPVIRYSDQSCLAPGTVCFQESRRVGWGRFWRPDRHSFAVTLPVRLLGRDVQRYGWRVWLSFFNDERCPEHSGEAPNKEWGDYVCSDYAPEPNRTAGRYRWIWHDL